MRWWRPGWTRVYCGGAVGGEGVGVVDGAVVLEGVVGDGVDGGN